MGFLDKLFGKGGSDTAGADAESALETLAGIYGDPEVKADGGVSITGPRANEIRDLGRKLAKAGGKERMVEVRDALRARYPWAASNLENIWSSLPEWRG